MQSAVVVDVGTQRGRDGKGHRGGEGHRGGGAEGAHVGEDRQLVWCAMTIGIESHDLQWWAMMDSNCGMGHGVCVCGNQI